VSIGDHRRELRGAENAGANLLDEVDMRQEGAARIGVRIQPSNAEAAPCGAASRPATEATGGISVSGLTCFREKDKKTLLRKPR